MQKLWKVVLEGRGSEPKVRLALGLRYAHGLNVGTLDYVRFKLAESGFTNGGGKPYSRERVKQFVQQGLCDSLKLLTKADDARIDRAVAALIRQKVHYSRSISTDPFLNGRLEWWPYRKVGKKPNGSWYERRR